MSLKQIDNNNLENYNFFVPPELTAQTPCERRDASKLLVCNKDKDFVKDEFLNIANYIPENALLLFNDSKVFPCRLMAQKSSGGKVEVFLLDYPQKNHNLVLKALVKPLKKIKVGEVLYFQNDNLGKVINISHDKNSPIVDIEFDKDYYDVCDLISSCGHIPLPPYIKRSLLDDKSKEFDKIRYQTIYAKNTGSVAAPTAGLHFTEQVFQKFKDKNIKTASITLHVGMGTFLPIRSDDITQHHMHQESYLMPSETLFEIEKAIKEKRSIIAVGTTTLRCLESFYLQAQEGKSPLNTYSNQWLTTSLYIYPQQKAYKPWCCDALITNFHQPKSSLFLLIHSLLGYDKTMQMYNFAVNNKYRFFSYGDSNLIWL